MKKKLLLGTTALIAAGVATSGVAQAEEAITAGISGYFRSAIAVISQDDADGELANTDSSITQSNDIEIGVGGSTTLDNGITVGFNANIEGNGGGAEGSAALDERYVFFNGSFGQIQLGQVESARQAMTGFAPSGNYNFGVNSPFFIHGNPGNTAFVPFANVRTYDDGLGNEDSIKMVYYSPSFNGFKFGASYAAEDGFNGAYTGNSKDALGGLQNNAAISATFDHNFGEMSLRLMAGYETYTLETCNVNAAGITTVASFTNPTLPATATNPTIRTTADQNCDDNPDSTQFGASLSFGEWSIGGGLLSSSQIANDSGGGGRNRSDMDLGVAWWSGAYGIGVQYGQAELDDAGGLTDQFDMFEVNGTYVLGPGIDIGATIRRGNFDDATDTAANLDNEFTEFAIGVGVVF
jgi:hypothetical protein